MTDVGRRQFLGTIAAIAATGFSGTALGEDAAFEQRGPRGEWGGRPGASHWSADSEAHLREEMRCWVGGIKDEHDLVIDLVKSRVREEVSRRRVRPEASDEDLRREIDAWTSEENVELMFQRGQLFKKLVRNSPMSEPYEPPATLDEVRSRLEDTAPSLESLRRREREKFERRQHMLKLSPFAGEDPGHLYLDERGDLCAV